MAAMLVSGEDVLRLTYGYARKEEGVWKKNSLLMMR